MVLINKRTEDELTKEQKLNIVKNKIISINTDIYSQMQEQHTRIFNMVWNNPYDLTPQEVLDEFGTDAGYLFTLSEQIQTILKTVDSDYRLLTTPNEYVKNSDGTVIVGVSKY